MVLSGEAVLAVDSDKAVKGEGVGGQADGLPVPPGGQEQLDPLGLEAMEAVQDGGGDAVGPEADQGAVDIKKDSFDHRHSLLLVCPPILQQIARRFHVRFGRFSLRLA